MQHTELNLEIDRISTWQISNELKSKRDFSRVEGDTLARKEIPLFSNLRKNYLTLLESLYHEFGNERKF